MIETQADKPSVTFTVPSWILAIFKIVDYGSKKVVNSAESLEEKIVKRPSFKFNFPREKLISVKNKFVEVIKAIKGRKKVALIALVVVLVLGFIVFKITKPARTSGSGVNSFTSSENSTAKINVNKKFDVSIKTKDGKETGDKLHVAITTIEETNSILVQDKPVRTKDGKIFLLLNMEIENTTKQELAIKPNDMVRLVDNEGRSFAPEVYNNGVTADAVSIKKTRVGYVVDSSQKTFKLMIGEVRVKQEQIEVSF